MTTSNDSNEPATNRSKWIFAVLPFATALVYFFSNPKPQSYYDYTFRVADNMLHGAIGFVVRPPSWLNEFVPFNGFYYSVFPLGSVLSMLPFAIPVALLRSLNVITDLNAITDMPGAFIAAFLAGASCFYLLKIVDKYEQTPGKKILLVLAMLFGTWMWTNLTFDGTWQLALGFTMLGELGAIYFTVFERKPLVAGAFFALAFGNRTEVLLTAPIFLYLLSRGHDDEEGSGEAKTEVDRKRSIDGKNGARRKAPIRDLVLFCSVPFVLGVLTLVYNYVRFDSFADFGYARIPGVLNEPWYNHGIFSIQYIPRQAWEMLGKMWNFRQTFPYMVPDGFSSSILWSSPFLLFAFRFGSRDKVLKYAAWTAIVVLTLLLWIHGNSGGWQFGYRYAMVLLPWIFLILLENSPKKISPLEWAAYTVSFAMNIFATWLFHWTEYVKP